MPPQPSHQALFKRCVLARRGIKLPLPQNPPQAREDNVYKLLLDGPLQTPKIPKTISQLAVHFDFRIFPDSPKQKAQQGLGTASRDLFF